MYLNLPIWIFWRQPVHLQIIASHPARKEVNGRFCLIKLTLEPSQACLLLAVIEYDVS
jgi:hypothetical protein